MGPPARAFERSALSAGASAGCTCRVAAPSQCQSNREFPNNPVLYADTATLAIWWLDAYFCELPRTGLINDHQIVATPPSGASIKNQI